MTGSLVSRESRDGLTGSRSPVPVTRLNDGDHSANPVLHTNPPCDGKSRGRQIGEGMDQLPGTGEDSKPWFAALMADDANPGALRWVIDGRRRLL